MGFDHAKTTHHFRLTQDGGSIEVLVNDPADSESLRLVRQHLNEIAKLFSQGDLAKPKAIHDQVPPGVPEMVQWKEAIQYQYEDKDLGGRVRISTQDPKAIQAVHEFLRFQITDHATGDPLEVQ